MLEIRPAREADIEDIQRVARRTIKACFPSFLGDEQVASFVDSGLSDLEIASHKDNLFAMLDACRIVGFSILLGDLIHLMMVDVEPHRRGYGARLLEWCEAEVVRHGRTEARLETFTGNAQAVAFYRRHGWSEVSRDGGEGGFQRSRWIKPLG